MKKMKSAEQGFTLVEVLVSMVILGVGLLGIAALQSTAVKNTNTSNMRGQVAILAANLSNRIRLNRQEALVGTYLVNARPAVGVNCSQNTTCTGNQMANYDLRLWYRRLDDLLGAGKASAEIKCFIAGVEAVGGPCLVNAVFMITIKWKEQVGKDEEELVSASNDAVRDGLLERVYSTGFQL